MEKKTYRSFESAREFAQKLGLKNREQWQAHCKSGNNPDDIPASAGSIYKKDFKGWGDFLGSGNVKPGDVQSRSFEEARKFATSLKLKGGKEWQAHCKSGDKPDDIPSHPDRTYKNKGWTNWGDFLGSGTIASKDMKDNVFLSFEEARKFVRELRLKDTPAWNEYRKSNLKPGNIPSTPNAVYKNDGWVSIPDWLDNGNLSNTVREWLTYEECQKFAQKNNITSQIEWEKFDKKPSTVPSHPDRKFPKQWKNGAWGKFLGTNRVAYQDRDETYLPWPEAKKEYLRLGKKYGLKNAIDFRIFFRKNPTKLPANLPANPQVIYTKERVWKKMNSEKIG